MPKLQLAYDDMDRIKNPQKYNNQAGISRFARDAAPASRRGARDEEAPTAEDFVTIVKTLFKGLDPAERDRLRELIAEMLDDDSEPPPFSGRPRPGGKMDPIGEQAMDSALLRRLPASDQARMLQRRQLERRQLAADARLAGTPRAAAGSFAERFPAAARVGKL